MSSSEPKPLANESPAAYAHRVGKWFFSWNKPDKALAQFFTPLPVAHFMSSLLPALGRGAIRVLDAGAGLGILSCALCEALEGDIEIEACEIDARLVDYLESCLLYAQRWMQSRNRNLTYRIVRKDFILTYGKALDGSNEGRFDIVIANPPYFKIPKSDVRAQLARQVVYGQPNIYALFMAVGVAQLCPGGYAVFITPRSYAAGYYFSRFREYFFAETQPRGFHVFESRRDVFDDVLQESLITLVQRSNVDSEIFVSSSTGFNFKDISIRQKPSNAVLSKNKVLHLPLSKEDDVIAEIVHSWTGTFHQYGMEVSTGPVVPFRATKLVSSTGNVPSTHAPLLWMQNIKPMCCTWPVKHTRQYLALAGAEKLLLPNRNYVLLRRFSAKEEAQRLVAAPYLAQLNTAFIGLENHLNYIYRPYGELTEDETRGLAILLNSNLLDSYFRIFNGNTQVSATELRNLPLPPLDSIIQLGRLAADSSEDINVLTAQVLGLYA
jgi:adenine-specific DNA-methyltransferase